MRLRLYVVHGSHPCAAVEKALSLKGLNYSVVEWPPPAHALFQTAIFGKRTVPGLSISGNGSGRSEKVSGSRAIMRRLDELVATPALYPTEGARRAAVEEAERWGDEVFQPVARELIWVGMVGRPDAMVSYSEHSRLKLPAPAVRATAPLIARMACRLNRTNPEVARRDLAALPGQLDKIDGWIADGTIGDTGAPNAADLQLLSTVRLIMTLGDARPVIQGRPCASVALSLFPVADGDMPVGAVA
jgi:glutathione S-transferase